MAPLRVFVLAAACALAAAQQTPYVARIASRLTANSLKADVAFLSSDALEGRATPSRGLDIAAEYIAAQFRRAGLEPAGDDGYFQTATTGDDSAKVRNVIAVLRGSDPALRSTYLIVSAHYDHLGIRDGQLYAGANDDASGTASLVEIAGALAALPTRPRRSVVFLAFFGEESDEEGSHYYTHHPVFPLARTVADLNLEQLGRTDDTEGPRIGAFSLTGFGFTNLAAFLRPAALEAGIRVVNAPASDRYFPASDNLAFAEAGVPSTTAAVAFDFPDYHQPGDTWQKLDYRNMAKVDVALALGVYRIANSTLAPHWNALNPSTAAFIRARNN